MSYLSGVGLFFSFSLLGCIDGKAPIAESAGSIIILTTPAIVAFIVLVFPFSVVSFTKPGEPTNSANPLRPISIVANENPNLSPVTDCCFALKLDEETNDQLPK